MPFKNRVFEVSKLVATKTQRTIAAVKVQNPRDFDPPASRNQRETFLGSKMGNWRGMLTILGKILGVNFLWGRALQNKVETFCRINKSL